MSNTSFKKGLAVGMLLGGGSDKLIRKDITENGEYDPKDEDPSQDGYNYVTVSVETYEDELAEALEELAEANEKLADFEACFEAMKTALADYGIDLQDGECPDQYLPVVYDLGPDKEEQEQDKEDDPPDSTPEQDPQEPDYDPDAMDEFVEELNGDGKKYARPAAGHHPELGELGTKTVIVNIDPWTRHGQYWGHYSGTIHITVKSYGEKGDLMSEQTITHGLNINFNGDHSPDWSDSKCTKMMTTTEMWSGSGIALQFLYDANTDKLNIRYRAANIQGYQDQWDEYV